MLKNLFIFFLLIFIGNSIINACSRCCINVDERNNKALVDDIISGFTKKETTLDELAVYLQRLPSFLEIFKKKDEIDIQRIAENLSIKISQGHAKEDGLFMIYPENLTENTIDRDVLIKAIKEVRTIEKIPNDESKCVIL